jgi:hypothetical protein
MSTSLKTQAATKAPELTTISLDELEATGREEDRGFGQAIAYGSIVGIVAFTIVVAIAVKLVAPDLDAGGIAAIAIWTGAWAGLFLGGTIAVGRWSMRQGH